MTQAQMELDCQITTTEPASAHAPAPAAPSPHAIAAARARRELAALARALTGEAKPPAPREAVRLLWALRRLWKREVAPLCSALEREHPREVTATTGAIEAAARVRAAWRRLAWAGVRGAARLRLAPLTAALAPAVMDLLEALDRLVAGHVALAFRPHVQNSLAGLDPSAPYACFRADALNRGAVLHRPSAANGPRAATLVEAPLGGLIWPSFVVDGEGHLYGGHARSELLSLDRDGQRRWTIRDPQLLYIDSTGALGRDGFLYLASTDIHPRGHQNQGRIWKVDPASGEVAWTFWGRHFDDPEARPDAQLASFFEGHVALGYERGRVTIYAGSDDCHVYKIDDQGALVWDYRAGEGPSHHIWTKPCLSADGAAVYIGTVGGEVHAIATASGERLWRRRMPGGVVSSIAVGERGELCFGCFDGNVYALYPEDGAIAWTFPTLGLIYASPAICPASGDVVIGSGDGCVYRLDRYGRKRWSYRTSAPIKSSPLIDGDGGITIGNEQGTIYRLDRDGRRVWSFASGLEKRNDINASPSMDRDGTVIVGSTDGRLFLIGARWAEANARDPRVSLDPGPDGDALPIRPGGAVLFALDHRGHREMPSAGRDTPRADDAPFALAPRQPHEPLVLELCAVDRAGDPVAARLDPLSVVVEVTPPVPFVTSVAETGRAVHIVWDALVPPGHYDVQVRAAYEAEGEQRTLARALSLEVVAAPSAGAPRSPGSPKSEGRVPSYLVGDWVLFRPKEVDALAQAGMDAMTYQMAFVPHPDDAARFVAVGASVALEGGAPVYKPHAPNRFVGTGALQDGVFRLEGPARTLAQGNRCRFTRVVMGGAFGLDGAIERGAGALFLPAAGAVGFEDVLRAMRLCDPSDTLVASGSFGARPLDNAASAAPADLAIAEVTRAAAQVSVAFATSTYRADEHWVHAVVLDPANGDAVDPEHTAQRVAARPDGVLASLTVELPSHLAGREVTVVVLADLFPLATLRTCPG